MSSTHALGLRLDIRLETKCAWILSGGGACDVQHPGLGPSPPQVSPSPSRRNARNVADPLRTANSDEARFVLNGTHETASVTSPENRPAQRAAGWSRHPPVRPRTGHHRRTSRQLSLDTARSSAMITWTPPLRLRQDTNCPVRVKLTAVSRDPPCRTRRFGCRLSRFTWRI
jgi:hypothetical protein